MKTKNYPGANTKQEPTSGIKVVSLPENLFDNTRWKLGGCPRCDGDVFLDSEDGQTLGHCLQCGYVGIRRRAEMDEAVFSE